MAIDFFQTKTLSSRLVASSGVAGIWCEEGHETKRK